MNEPAESAILIVDDEDSTHQSLGMTLRSRGFKRVLHCRDGRQVPDLLAQEHIALVLLDLAMPHISGREILAHIAQEHPEVLVSIITGQNELETAVECMQAGAFDYLVKPLERPRLISSVQRAMELVKLRHENSLLKACLQKNRLARPEAFAGIVTRDETMLGLFAYIELIAKTPYPVLITGETGTGKELIAEVLHHLSGRAGKFIKINIAGLDETVFSDTLFGHRKGAFTGASQDRAGLLEKAAGGTLFLDEIGDLSISSQVKLLRLVQEGEFFPLGADSPKKSDARVLVATNRDIATLQADPGFRRDLYYRLKTHHIHLPPLRNRFDDLPLLINHFLEQAAASEHRRPPGIPDKLIELLQGHPFPGNIRELKAMVCNALSLSPGKKLALEPFRMALSDLPITDPAAPPRPEVVTGRNGVPFPTLKEAESQLIAEALRRTDGNQQQAAHLLGITRQALNRRLNRAKKKGTAPVSVGRLYGA